MGNSPSWKGGILNAHLDGLERIHSYIYPPYRASIHDSKVMDEIPVVANAYYLMDKGYVKFDSLDKHFHQNHAWFVTRAKDNMLYTVIEYR